jgi:hypothetical protein
VLLIIVVIIVIRWKRSMEKKRDISDLGQGGDIECIRPW